MVTTPTTGAAGSGAAPADLPLALGGPIAGARSPLIGRDYARPAGVALRLDLGRDADEAFEIALVDAHGQALLVLGPFGEDDVVAVWRGLGAASGLPLMLEDAHGALQKPYPQIGPVHLGDIRIRRLHGLLKGRRPRFLVRRKTARLPRQPHIHCKREIIAGSGT